MPRTKAPAKRPVGRPRKNWQENVPNWQENVPNWQENVPNWQENVPKKTIFDRIMERDELEQSRIEETLNERHDTYGYFIHLAGVSQQLKKVLFHELAARNKDLAPDQIEALEMIMHKIARIVNGDADHIDSWHDISGYATLVADRLKGNVR
jgi:hypothetical protein